MRLTAKRLIRLIVVIGFAAYALVPVDVVIAPAAVFTVVDPLGKPVQGAKVSEIWYHYSLSKHGDEEIFSTDNTGRVEMPRRVVRASLLRRFVGCLGQYTSTGVHASCGPDAMVVAWSGNYQASVYFYDSGPIPTRIVLEERYLPPEIEPPRE